ncbi:MAG: hypothetical protein J7502_08730 [Flavisolibacter sp.]|nr:hypothetical protein [Flavisolibacter sp.]
MKTINHLSKEEQLHYILCHCGEYVDMRNLTDVFSHQHTNLPEPEWSYSIKKDQPVAHSKSGKMIDLN